MKKAPFTLDMALRQNVISPDMLSDALMSNIAEDLIIAAGTVRPVNQLSDQLTRLFIQVFKQSLPTVRDAIRARGTAPADIHQAFLLGQLAFAQLQASQLSIQRIDGAFTELLTTPANAGYFQELLTGPKPILDLMQSLNLDSKTVFEAIKRLIAAGLVDFRWNGANTEYFLTAPALEAINAIPLPFADHVSIVVSLEESPR